MADRKRGRVGISPRRWRPNPSIRPHVGKYGPRTEKWRTENSVVWALSHVVGGRTPRFAHTKGNSTHGWAGAASKTPTCGHFRTSAAPRPRDSPTRREIRRRPERELRQKRRRVGISANLLMSWINVLQLISCKEEESRAHAKARLSYCYNAL